MGIDAVMVAKVPHKADDVAVRRWSHVLCDCLGHRNFLVDYERGRHAIEIVEGGRFFDSDQEIHPDPGGSVLNIRVLSRYYGEGYQRGDAMLIINTARIVEMLVPNVEIWYGGDSGDVEAIRFDEEARSDLFSYFVSAGYHDRVRPNFNDPNAFACVCSMCHMPMYQLAPSVFNCACGAVVRLRPEGIEKTDKLTIEYAKRDAQRSG